MLGSQYKTIRKHYEVVMFIVLIHQFRLIIDNRVEQIKRLEAEIKTLGEQIDEFERNLQELDAPALVDHIARLLRHDLDYQANINWIERENND